MSYIVYGCVLWMGIEITCTQRVATLLLLRQTRYLYADVKFGQIATIKYTVQYAAT